MLKCHEVEGHGGVGVAVEHAARVGLAGRGGEGRAVDEIAVVGGECDLGAVDGAGFGCAGAGLGVLASEAADADDGAFAGVDEHEGHLQEDLEFVGDELGAAVFDLLGAVAALEKEAAAVLGFGDLGFEALDRSEFSSKSLSQIAEEVRNRHKKKR